MRTEYVITMDAHCRSSDVCIKTAKGKLVRRDRVSTGIPQLQALIESVPRPRRLAFEEGAIAGWLYRNLKNSADEVVVCDPRRNAYVAKDGDKDDPIDAEKLNDLYRGGFLKAVHQQESSQKAGIGLRRRSSGAGLEVIFVEQACNHLLRNVVIGAAQSAIDQKENVFAERYARWIKAELSFRNARRNVARDPVTAIWGMWKSDKAFDARLLQDPH